jgi:hypothetical protein
MPLDKSGNDLRKYMGDRTLFIETGTAVGDGVASALKAGFEEIHSVELSQSLAGQCQSRFNGNSKVHLTCGSSETWLPQLLETVDRSFVLWLDAHCSGGPHIGDAMHNYLPVELNSLMEYKEKLKDSVIMVDDMGHYLHDKQFCSKIENLLTELRPHGNLEYYRPEGTPYVILVSQ